MAATKKATFKKAEKLAALLRDFANEVGMDERDVFVNPDGRWGLEVSWESGPYEWAVAVNHQVSGWLGTFTEPGTSYSLCLYDESFKWDPRYGETPTSDSITGDMLTAMGFEL